MTASTTCSRGASTARQAESRVPRSHRIRRFDMLEPRRMNDSTPDKPTSTPETEENGGETRRVRLMRFLRFRMGSRRNVRCAGQNDSRRVCPTRRAEPRSGRTRCRTGSPFATVFQTDRANILQHTHPGDSESRRNDPSRRCPVSIGTEKFSFFVIENFPLGALDRSPGPGVGGVCLGGAVGNRVGVATAPSLAPAGSLFGPEPGDPSHVNLKFVA